MKVCLINPPRLMKPISASMKPAPPLGLAFIAAALKHAGHEVSVIDTLAEGPDDYYQFKDDIISNGLSFEDTVRLVPSDVELIGVSIMFSGNWILNRQLIEYLGVRFPMVTIIAGGEHITACPEFCIGQTKHLTACILGEGEETIIDFITAIEKGAPLANVAGITWRNSQNQVITNPRRNRIKDITEIQWPAWELFPLQKYTQNSITLGVDRGVISIPILATRGCPYSCTFCSSPQMWGTRYYMRTPVDVVNEIEAYKNKYGAANFDFYDLTAIIEKEWIISFCEELLSRKLDITWQIPAGTRSEVIDREVAHYLYKSGCLNITYAPESGSRQTLKLIKKKVNLNNMLQSIQYSSREKMNIKINFMIGFPSETHRNIWQSLWFLVKASWYGVNDMAPSIFSPYPGSMLFEKLRKEGKIKMENDEYFYEILYVDTFFNSGFYNENIHPYLLRIYLFSYLFVFYSTNYLFNPSRFFRTMRNLATSKFESRGEMALGELMKRTKIKARPQLLTHN